MIWTSAKYSFLLNHKSLKMIHLTFPEGCGGISY